MFIFKDQFYEVLLLVNDLVLRGHMFLDLQKLEGHHFHGTVLLAIIQLYLITDVYWSHGTLRSLTLVLLLFRNAMFCSSR